MSEPSCIGRPPRLALISSGLGYTVRGIELWMADLARHLSPELDIEAWGGGPRPYGSAPGYRTHRLVSLNRDAALVRLQPWSRRYLWEQWSMLPQVVLALRQRRRDIAYLGDPVLAWHLKRLRPLHRARVVFMNGMRLSPRWARGFDGVHLLAGPYLEEARRELQPAGIDTSPFFAIPHFTDIEAFRPASPAEKAGARVGLGLPPTAFVVLTFGPIGTVSRKRLDHLAREVAAGGPTALLVHAGGPEDGAEGVRAAVNEALGARVRWMGRVDRFDVARLLRAADAYSLGSLAEPFSIAILEALASGLPVVHHADTVMTWQTGEGGLPVSMETPGAAAEAFRRLAGQPEERSRVGTAARALAEQRYAPESVCSALTDAWRTVASRPVRRGV